MISIWKLLYPDVCPFCGRAYAKIICNDCRKQVICTEEPVCKKCGKPIRNEQAEYCEDCRKRMEKSTCWFDSGRSLWVHRSPVSESIYQFKFHNRRIYAKYYALAMAQKFEKWIYKKHIQVLIPVPMDPGKRRKRGYNQAEVLAKELGKILHISVDTKLIKKKKTMAQKTLEKYERERNLKGSFKVGRKTDIPQCVLVIDDIYTTGNTINEVAKTLKKAGVEMVFFLTISIGQDI